MPAELVLLSTTAPTDDDLLGAALTVVPDAAYLDWADGTVRQLLDTEQRTLVQVYRSRPVTDPDRATTMVTVPADGYRYWTDINIPGRGSPEPGEAIAAALARTTGGTIARRR